MKKFALTLLVAGMATTAMAADLVVQTGGTYETINTALVALDRTDGTADSITLNNDTFETVVSAVDYTTGTDALTIDGAGNAAIFATASASAASAITVTLADNAVLAITDLTVAPEFAGAGELTWDGVALFVDDNDVIVSNVALTLDGFVVTGSTTANAPVAVDAAAPADITRFINGSSPYYAGGVRINTTAAGTSNQITITDSSFSHTAHRALYINTGSGTTIDATDCTSNYNTGPGFRPYSVSGVINFTRCSATGNVSGASDGHGFESTGTGAGTINFVDCQSVGNSSYGMRLACADMTYNLLGTVSAPILLTDNGNRGLRTGDGTAIINTMQYVYCINNGSYGLEFNEVDDANSWVGSSIENCIFALNGSIEATPMNVRVGDTAEVTAVPFPFVDCTFFNATPLDVSDPLIIFPQQVGDSWKPHTYSFTDCLFVGGDSQNDFVFGSNQASTVFNADYCSIVTSGANAQTVATAANLATINQTNIVDIDPEFASIDPADANFLSATNDALLDQASDGGILEGAVAYSGPPASISDWTIMD
jgi:hypothetical protein